MLQNLGDRLPSFGFLGRKQPVQRLHDGDRDSEPCKDLAQLQTNRAPPSTINEAGRLSASMASWLVQ